MTQYCVYCYSRLTVEVLLVRVILSTSTCTSERGRQWHVYVKINNEYYVERGRHPRMRIMLQNGVVHTFNMKVHADKMAFRRSDYFLKIVISCTAR